LPEASVDLVISLATANVDETPLDRLAVSVLCIETLAKDGQFARLNIIADRLSLLRRELEGDRDILGVVVEAFAKWLKGSASQALRDLNLALERLQAEPAGRSVESESDLVLLTSLKSVLEQREVDERWDTDARNWFLEMNDGLGLLLHDAIRAYGASSALAAPATVLTAADPIFRESQLADYVASRPVATLFPAQIDALVKGATRAGKHVVALPTSSGKTLLAEFRVAASSARYPGSTSIYVAPYRLLSRQVRRSMGLGLEPLGLRVRDLGAGFDASEGASVELGGVDVAVCTPERLDSLLRLADVDSAGGAEASDFLRRCRLLIFDELQMVGRPGRGPRFELLITRVRERFPGWEVLGLSAATHGADDLARWLVEGSPITGARRPTGTLEVVWETDGTLQQRVEARVTPVGHVPRSSSAVDDAASLILRFGRAHQPVLAVETSRQNAESLARKVHTGSPEAGQSWRDGLDRNARQYLDEIVEEVRAVLGEGHRLADLILNGVAFHHAGVPTHLLRHIESLSQRRLLRVLCSTTTVAEGADLPFRIVVIPHLNFPGPTRRLERDLYLNIVGRAGRANVSVEGMVFILNSDAATLKSVVRGSLWSNALQDRVRGRLSDAVVPIRDFDSLNLFFDIQSQVMGWLGDGSSYIEDQAEHLASRTLSWLQGNSTERDRISNTLEAALADLEARDFAVAASPYRLTPTGMRARQTGLSAISVENLTAQLEGISPQRFLAIEESQLISSADARWISELLFQSVEMLQHSLWLRRAGSGENGRFRVLAGSASRDAAWPGAQELSADIELLALWIEGNPLQALAEAAPPARSAVSLFGGRDPDKLTSDAAEYVGKLSYPAGWVWSAVRVLVGEHAPNFVRPCVEHGVPSSTAAALIREVALTRDGANRIAGVAGPVWPEAIRWVRTAGADELSALGLTRLDWKRLVAWANVTD